MLGRRFEIEGLRADGEVFPLELAITEVRLPGQRLFTAYLRDLTAAKAAAAALRQIQDAMHQSAAAPGQYAALTVDDEPEVAAVLAQMAAKLGFHCDVETGAAACDLLEQRDYDAILCDLHVPDIDGAVLFAWLGARKPYLQDRVVFITADTLGQAASKLPGPLRPTGAGEAVRAGRRAAYPGRPEEPEAE